MVCYHNLLYSLSKFSTPFSHPHILPITNAWNTTEPLHRFDTITRERPRHACARRTATGLDVPHFLCGVRSPPMGLWRSDSGRAHSINIPRRLTVGKGALDMLDRVRPFEVAERGVNGHKLGARNDAGQQDRHGLRILAARVMATSAPARITSRHWGGAGMSAMRLDMVGFPGGGARAAPQPPRFPRRTPTSNARRRAARGGSAKRWRRRSGTKRAELPLPGSSRRGLVLTVGAGLGYGLSGEPGAGSRVSGR